MASTLAANAAVDGVIRGAWLEVAYGLAAWLPVFLVRGTIHKPVRVDYGAAGVADGAVYLCESYNSGSSFAAAGAARGRRRQQQGGKYGGSCGFFLSVRAHITGYL